MPGLRYESGTVKFVGRFGYQTLLIHELQDALLLETGIHGPVLKWISIQLELRCKPCIIYAIICFIRVDAGKNFKTILTDYKISKGILQIGRPKCP